MYTLSDYTPSGGVTATRRDDYWGEKPKVARFDVKPIPDVDTMRLAAQQGDIAGSFEIPADQLRQWTPQSGLRAEEAPGLNLIYLSYPVDTAPFDNVHVRRALALCLDRAGFVKSLFDGAAEAATSITTRGHWQGIMTPAEAEAYLQSLPAYAFDVDAAKAELALSDSPSGFTADLIFDREDQIGQKIATSLAAEAAKVGMTLNLSPVAGDEIRNSYIYGDESGLLLYGFYFSYADPIDYMQQMLPTDLIGLGNSAHYSNTEVDQLMKDQAAASGSQRADLLRRMGVIAQEDLPYAPIAWNASTIGISDTIRFVDFDAFDAIRPNWAASIGRPA
jgi:peptide/nickel transport system substrate-binding protein